MKAFKLPLQNIIRRYLFFFAPVFDLLKFNLRVGVFSSALYASYSHELFKLPPAGCGWAVVPLTGTPMKQPDTLTTSFWIVSLGAPNLVRIGS